ncbi:M16 family metallopeptidase [Schlesneria paludicola]|uniref:M16 family metallopeptidase n=1 Tax=Schlesneria paludicola TaxID=360056 RepID=UPI0006819343|nr:pitrilysin family protein [Schlesneria paludicola]
MLMRLVAGALAISSAILGFTLHGAEAPKVMKITTIEGISEHRLENGMKVLLFPDPSKPTVTVNLTVFVGSRHEGYGEAGMAHLLEHMLFKGTPDHPSVPKLLQARGAEFNGTTWLDRTNYYETLPANDDNLEFAIRLEADRMTNSYVKGEDLASEMTVVRNEFERGENNPHSILSQRIMSAAFNWHNYGQSTIGNRADIEKVPVENLKAFYKRYYQPDNAMVIIAGRFEEPKALELVGKYFGAIPKPERILTPTYTEEPAQDGERTVALRRVGEVSVVGALYHIPSGGHPDFAPIDVLESVLTMTPSGRLYKALVEQKKASSVSGAAYALHDPGVLRFMAEVATGNSPEAVLDGLLDSLQSVIDQGVKDEEVERAKQRLLKQREQEASNSAQLAVHLSEWAAQGDWRLYFIYRDRLEQVTAKDVSRVARAYLQPSNRTIGIYYPTKEAQRTPIPATPNLDEMIGDYKGRSDTAVGEAFDVDPRKIEGRTTRKMIEGVKVALLPKKTRGNTVVLRLNLCYGDEKTLFGMSKATSFLPFLMTKGTKQLTRQQLQDQLDKNLASLGTTSSAGDATFVIQTKRDNLVAVIDLLRQVLREPVFPASELEILKRGHRSDLEQGSTDPQQLALKAVRRALNPYPIGDVRYYPTSEEEIRQTDEVDIATLKKLYSDFVGAQAGQLTIVGDFDEEPTVQALTSMLRGWKAKQPYERIPRNVTPDIKADLIQIATPDKANAFYFSGGVIPMRDDDPDYPALVIGNYIFGAGALSSRLGDRIRQKEGLSYGVGSSMVASSLDTRATLTMYAIYNPANLEKIVDGISEELDRFLNGGVTQKELDDARRGFLQGQEVMRTEDSKLAQVLESTLVADRTMDYYVKMEQRIAELTPEKIRDTFRKHIDPKKILTAVAGDWAAAKKAAESTEKK